MTGNERLFLGKDDAAIRRAPVVLSRDDLKRGEDVVSRAIREFESGTAP